MYTTQLVKKVFSNSVNLTTDDINMHEDKTQAKASKMLGVTLRTLSGMKKIRSSSWHNCTITMLMLTTTQ